MNDWFFKQGGRHQIVNWLALDAWFDSSLSTIWRTIVYSYSAASNFFARFRLKGWRRIINELFSEGFTIATGGIILMYGLALPAFKEIDEKNWLAMDQFSVTFQDKNGNFIGKRGINLNDAVPLEEIPDFMVKALLSTEDRRFFEHIGVDFIGTFRALVENIRASSVVQGGSTLTQQLAKNLFLSPERSIIRKIKEVYLSLWLEARLSKREILKLYLDRSYMGGGAFGVEAASQFYFGKSVRDITMAEAAMMAGLFKAPTKFAPHINLPRSRARANEVLSNLVEAKYYTSGEVYNARLNPAQPIERREMQSPDWFLDFAYEEIQKKITDKRDFVLTARTTVDMELQQFAEQAVTSKLSMGKNRNKRIRRGSQTTSALVSMETDGAVRAMVGGLDYGESQFNRATHAKRQPGSSFKVYVYASALENGYKSRSILRDSGVTCGRWSPRNYNGSYGSGARISMTDALRRSLNTTAVSMSLKVGRKKVIDLAERLGIKGIRPSCSMALGDRGITLTEHAGGYAAFANGGFKAEPYAILEAYNSQGELVYSREKNETKARRVFSRSVAEQMNQMMSTVVSSGTGRAAQLNFTHAVGKTGTSSGYRDAWFMGFSGRYVTGVWVGKDNFRPVYRSGGRGMTGGSLPAQIWQSYMSVAHASRDIPTIPGLPVHPVQSAERRRLAVLRAQNPNLNLVQRNAANANKLISDLTVRILQSLNHDLKIAAGLQVKPSPQSGNTSPPRTKPDSRAAASSKNSIAVLQN